jgi:hypothetical protein
VEDSSESGVAVPQHHTDTELSTTATESRYHRSAETGAPAQSKREAHDDQVYQQQHYGSFYLRMGAVGKCPNVFSLFVPYLFIANPRQSGLLL